MDNYSAGHFAKDCPDGGSRACRNCGQEGHISKDCDQPRNMDLVTCRNCEETGHYSKECPKPRDCKPYDQHSVHCSLANTHIPGSKVQCTNCEEYGHTKVRCKQPPKDSEAFADQDPGNGDKQPTQADGYAGNSYDNSHVDNAGGDGGDGGDW
ncbi:hypothetical protein ACHAPX_002358 [Trichoderma viride]